MIASAIVATAEVAVVIAIATAIAEVHQVILIEARQGVKETTGNSYSALAVIFADQTAF